MCLVLFRGRKALKMPLTSRRRVDGGTNEGKQRRFSNFSKIGKLLWLKKRTTSTLAQWPGQLSISELTLSGTGRIYSFALLLSKSAV